MKQLSFQMTFPLGIPGFEAYREWNLSIEKDIPLAYLISAENEQIGFALTRPEIYFPTYLDDLVIDNDGKKALAIEEKTELEVWSILFVSKDVMQTTTNLKAPLVFNLSGNLGYQLIRSDEKYISRELLFKGVTG